MLYRWLVLIASCAAALSLFVSGATGGAEATTADFPVTITAGNGKVTIRTQPKRVISLSPTATESLFAIGAGKQVIAVDDQSDYPKSAPKTSLSGFTPNVEAIAAFEPDLVVVSYDPKGLVDALERLDIPVILHDAARSFPGAYQQIRQLGLVTGQRQGATKLIARMKTQIARVVRTSKDRAAGLTVYHELTPDFYSASSHSFVGKIYTLLGLENIADKADSSRTGYPQLSAEYIVASSPDLIVLADIVCCGQKASTVAARQGWSRIAAVQTNSVVRIDDSLASRWGPRLVNFFRAMATAIKRLKP